MDFSWPDEYLDYKNKVIAFAQKHLNVGTKERDNNQEFPLDLWRKCADFGIPLVCAGGKATAELHERHAGAGYLRCLWRSFG